MIIGYTTGVFDLFHIGHLNILRNAKAMCDRLIVGVTTDALSMERKNKRPTVPFEERCEIVRNIKYVDAVIAQETMDKFGAWKKLRFDIMFVGDDWYGIPAWKDLQKQFDEVGVRIIYFPYTRDISSTMINGTLKEQKE